MLQIGTYYRGYRLPATNVNQPNSQAGDAPQALIDNKILASSTMTSHGFDLDNSAMLPVSIPVTYTNTCYDVCSSRQAT